MQRRAEGNSFHMDSSNSSPFKSNGIYYNLGYNYTTSFIYIHIHVWAGNYSYIVLYQARQWRCASARGDTLPVACQQIIKMTLGLWL